MDKRTIELAGVQLTEKKWSGDVKTKWEPAEGFFTGSAKSIVAGLLAAGKDKAMSRLNFYINRAGKNLSDEDRARLEKAKEMLSKKLVKEDLDMIRQLAGLPVLEKHEEEEEEESGESQENGDDADELPSIVTSVAAKAEGKTGDELAELIMKVYQAGFDDGKAEAAEEKETE